VTHNFVAPFCHITFFLFLLTKLQKKNRMSQHFYDRVATFENLGHRGAVTGWEVYDFVSLEEATRDLPIPSISTRTL
jgi:hypothetical protein